MSLTIIYKMGAVTLSLLVALISLANCASIEEVLIETAEFKVIANGEDPLTISEPQPTQHWALIVAGSYTWGNYRHQADACHAYQIMKKHGIPEERIILMMYDDLADNKENPTPGIVINRPDGKDVYMGVKIDYKGKEVTPANFLAVLRGDAAAVKGMGTGRVIESGPNDHIFVNFADHGATGLVAFPTDMLYAKDLIKTIMEDMYKKNKYGQMVFYIEACESGSMFEGLLPTNVNVYATTASNARESSYACYYDKKRKTYLGDVYSVKWMEDSDIENMNTDTLHQQFILVKKETNTSHVMEYGDTSIGTETLGEFQAGSSFEDFEAVRSAPLPPLPYDAVPSEEVPKAILRHRIADAENNAERDQAMKEYEALVKHESEVELTMKHIVALSTRNHDQAARVLTSHARITDFDCHRAVVQAYNDKCYNLSQKEYALRQVFKLVNLCEENIAAMTIISVIKQVCGALLF